MAISTLEMRITCRKRPWFKPALYACFALVKMRVIDADSAANFLAHKCMDMRVDGPISGRNC